MKNIRDSIINLLPKLKAQNGPDKINFDNFSAILNDANTVKKVKPTSKPEILNDFKNLHSDVRVSLKHYHDIFVSKKDNLLLILIEDKPPKNLLLAEVIRADFNISSNGETVALRVFCKDDKCGILVNEQVELLKSHKIRLQYRPKGKRIEEFEADLTQIFELPREFLISHREGDLENRLRDKNLAIIANTVDREDFFAADLPQHRVEKAYRVFINAKTYEFFVVLNEQKDDFENFLSQFEGVIEKEYSHLASLFKLVRTALNKGRQETLLASFYQILPEDIVPEAMNFLEEILKGPEQTIRQKFEFDNMFAANYSDLFLKIFEFTYINPKITEFGKFFPYINLYQDGHLEFLELRNRMGKPENFWNFQSNFPRLLENFIQKHEYPLLIEDLIAEFENFFTDKTNPTEIAKTMEELWHEANALKSGTLPPRAFVSFELGPFVGVEFIEKPNEVIFKWISEEGFYYLGRLVPDNINEIHSSSAVVWDGGCRVGSYFDYGIDSEKIMPDDYRLRPQIKEQIDLVQANLMLITVSMVRDFWVIEDRKSHFNSVPRTNLPRSENKIPEAVKVIYLPRKRYLRGSSAGDLDKGLQLSNRSKHLVKQHFRKSNITLKQQHLANLLRLKVPEGHTLVQSHFRGDGQSQVIYKSKSALETLCSVVETSLVDYVQKYSWFDFEQDVKELMKKQGYEILHQATNGIGDGGIDTLARKTRGDESFHISIQSKKWKIPVGPDVVRSLIGAIADAKHSMVGKIEDTADLENLRGAIYTTSYLTPEAKDIALRNNIECIDGEEWSRIIKRELHK